MNKLKTDFDKLKYLLKRDKFYHVVTKTQLRTIIQFAEYKVYFDKKGKFQKTVSNHNFIEVA